MRVFLLVVVCSAALLAGQTRERTSEAFTYDANGNRIGGRVTSTAGNTSDESRTERTMSVNGRLVPVETVEEKILEDGPRGKVVEQTIQRYDQTGRPTETERVLIEVRQDSAGRQTRQTTRSVADINGRFQVRERTSETSVERGATTQTTTVVERPTINGSMDVVQRRESRETTREGGSSQDTTIYNLDQGGRLSVAARETVDVVEEGDQSTTTTTRFNTVNASGELAFAARTIEETEKRPDGSERKVVSEYGAASPGRSISGTGNAHLREQLVIEQDVAADGSVVETTSVRRVSLSDPNRLGPYERVSEVVCRGQCLEQEEAGEEQSEEGGK